MNFFFPLSFGFVVNTHVEKNHSFLSSSSSSIWFFSFWIWREFPFGKKIIHYSHHLHHHRYGFFFLDLPWNPIWEKNHPFLSSSSSSSIWFFLFGFGVKSHLEKIIHSSHHLHLHHRYGFFLLDLVWNPIWKKSSIPLIIIIVAAVGMILPSGLGCERQGWMKLHHHLWFFFPSLKDILDESLSIHSWRRSFLSLSIHVKSVFNSPIILPSPPRPSHGWMKLQRASIFTWWDLLLTRFTNHSHMLQQNKYPKLVIRMSDLLTLNLWGNY